MTRSVLKDIIREAIEDNSTSISDEEIEAAADAAADKVAQELDEVEDDPAEPEEALEGEGEEIEVGL